jgi:S-methylmethionine-dependent homocysteine/selenocysteine methylase
MEKELSKISETLCRNSVFYFNFELVNIIIVSDGVKIERVASVIKKYISLNVILIQCFSFNVFRKYIERKTIEYEEL